MTGQLIQVLRLMSDSERFVVVGDIHGCYRSLEAMLKKLEPFSSSTFIFLGDYIDRGPDSKSVIDLLLDFQKHTTSVMLRGNHEQMMIQALDEKDFSLWMINGGRITLESYGLNEYNPDIPEEHYHFIKQTKPYYETDQYFFVHAGLPTDITIKQATQNSDYWYDFLWERSHLDRTGTAWEKRVVFGHTPVPLPLSTSEMLGIDTGCVYAHQPGMGYLTAAILPEEQFIYQKNLEYTYQN